MTIIPYEPELRKLILYPENKVIGYIRKAHCRNMSENSRRKSGYWGYHRQMGEFDGIEMWDRNNEILSKTDDDILGKII